MSGIISEGGICCFHRALLCAHMDNFWWTNLSLHGGGNATGGAGLSCLTGAWSHGLCDKECVVAWPLPVTASSVSKPDFRPMLFQKKRGVWAMLWFDCAREWHSSKGREWQCAAGVEGGHKAALLSGYTAFTSLCGLSFIVRPQLFSLKVK